MGAGEMTGNDDRRTPGLIPPSACPPHIPQEWYRWIQWPWNMPITSIREYFGAQIALYFSFLGHYTSWSLGLAIFGLPSTIEQASFPHAKSMRIIFVIGVAVWSVTI